MRKLIYTFSILAAIAFAVFGAGAFIQAKSVMHEMAGLLCFIITAMLTVGIAIDARVCQLIEEMKRTRPKATTRSTVTNGTAVDALDALGRKR